MTKRLLIGIRRRSVITLLSLMALLGQNALADSLPESVSIALRHSRIPANAVSVSLTSLKGEPLIQHQAEQATNPASTMKILTTLAALDLLGPQAKWETRLASEATVTGETLDGPLYLQGGGDPKLTLENLWLLARQLRLQGIRHIQGPLIQDRSFYQLPVPLNTDSSFDDNPERPYNVPPDALQANFGTLRFQLASDDTLLRLTPDPAMPGLKYSVDVSINPKLDCASPRAGLASRLIPAENGYELVITGQYPAQCSYSLYLAAPNNAWHMDALFRAIWQEMGGTMSPHPVNAGPTPVGARLLGSIKSAELSLLIRDINKFSNNTMARALFLNLGGGQTDTRNQAETTLRTWLSNHGLHFPELVLENGSGLSRVERISASHLAQLLQLAAHHRYANEFIASLPLLGQDGTLRNRLKTSNYTGMAHLKTGSLADVRALAGYVIGKDGQTRILVAIINHPLATQGAGVLDALLIHALEMGEPQTPQAVTQAK